MGFGRQLSKCICLWLCCNKFIRIRQNIGEHCWYAKAGSEAGGWLRNVYPLQIGQCLRDSLEEKLEDFPQSLITDSCWRFGTIWRFIATALPYFRQSHCIRIPGFLIWALSLRAKAAECLRLFRWAHRMAENNTHRRDAALTRTKMGVPPPIQRYSRFNGKDKDKTVALTAVTSELSGAAIYSGVFSIGSKCRKINDVCLQSRRRQQHHTWDSHFEAIRANMTGNPSRDYVHIICLGINRINYNNGDSRVRPEIPLLSWTLPTIERLCLRYSTAISREFCKHATSGASIYLCFTMIWFYSTNWEQVVTRGSW